MRYFIFIFLNITSNAQNDDHKIFFKLIDYIAYKKTALDIIRQENKSVYDKNICCFLKSKRHLIDEKIPYTRKKLLLFMQSFPNKNIFIDHMVKQFSWLTYF